MEGVKEEQWLSAFSALPEAVKSAKQVETALASTFAPRYGPDGTLRLAHGGGGLGRTGGRFGERSGNLGGSGGGSGGGRGDGGGDGVSVPKFALRGSGTNPSSAMSNGICNSNVMVGARGTDSSLFSSTGTNSASKAGKKRKSPERPTDCTTAAHMRQQHARQTSRACYSRSALGLARASSAQPKPEGPPAEGASIPGAAVAADARIMSTTIVDPHIPVPDARANQSDVREIMRTKERVDMTLESTQKSPRDERMVRYESGTNGRTCDVHDEWCTDDVLDDPKGRERSDMHGECGTDDERLPRCQDIRNGSAPNQRIKSRSMAERRRRERISEGLQRLKAKVRGRGDTCAMLDRAVRYVDALERRVMELERVVMAAAGSGRNVFPGNVFAGGAFAGRCFAGNALANNVAALTSIPAALASVPTGLGSDGVAIWPWE
ncbi:unnamed protein product [Closterium sp. Yama58-4]|nr:unnamed protein product [Closterium sp. Yama58-4]